MKILLNGYFGFGNLGDDLLLKTVYNIIAARFKDADIFILSNNTENNPGYSLTPSYNTYLFDLLETDRPVLIDWTYRGDFDLCVDAGGGIYFDYHDGGVGYGIANRIADIFSARTLQSFSSSVRRFTGKAGRQHFTKRVGLGVGLESFNKNARSYIRSKIQLGQYDLLVVREHLSAGIATKMGYNGPIDVSTDNVFLTDYWLPREFKMPHRPAQPGNIGFILMDWNVGDARYVEIEESIRRLQAAGYKITLFSLDRNHDKDYISYFSTKGQPVVVWEPEGMALIDYLTLLGQQDLLVTARAHGTIVGGILGIPSICIAIRQKLRAVQRMFASASLVDYPLDSNQLVEVVRSMHGTYGRLTETVAEDVHRNRRIAEMGLGRFLKSL